MKKKTKTQTKTTNKAAFSLLSYCCFGIGENKNLHRQIWVSQSVSESWQEIVRGLKTRLHKSSESHQRVAKHFREQLTEAQANQRVLYLHHLPYILVAISVLQKSHIFIHPYPFLFQNAALISLQMRRKIYISHYPCPAPWEQVCFSLIFFIVSHHSPQAEPPLQQWAACNIIPGWHDSTMIWYHRMGTCQEVKRVRRANSCFQWFGETGRVSNSLHQVSQDYPNSLAQAAFK